MGPKDADFYMEGVFSVEAHSCPEVEAIINTALRAMATSSSDGVKLIIKANAMDDIATHIPLHAVTDAAQDPSRTHGIQSFISSFFTSNLFDNLFGSSLFEGIIKLITEFFSNMFSIFRR